MSNKYKTAMDKITLSDEMKKKIMAAAAEKPDNENQKKIKRFPFGHVMSLAACIALVLIVTLKQNVPLLMKIQTKILTTVIITSMIVHNSPILTAKKRILWLPAGRL